MGKEVAVRSYLRAWGTTDYLDTKGMFKTNFTTASGATKRTWVYVVAGARSEPLLGDHDAEELGIVNFKPEGHAPEGEKGGESHEDGHKVSIPAMLRQAGKGDITERPPSHEVETKGKEEAKGIVSGYKRPVFTRYHEEGTDPHRKLPTRNGVFRGDEEDASTKTLTGTLHGEEDNSTKTHTGVLTRDREEVDSSTKTHNRMSI